MRPKALILVHDTPARQQAATIVAFHGFDCIVSSDVDDILDRLWEADDPFGLICVEAHGLSTIDLDTLIGIVADDWPETRLLVTSCTASGAAHPHVRVTEQPLTADVVSDMLGSR